MTAQLSRERLEAKIKHLEDVQRYRKNVQHAEIGLDLNADEKFQLEAYRMLLAGMDSEPVALQNFRDAMEGVGHIRRTLDETFGGLHGTHCEPDVLVECKTICDAICEAYRRTAPPAPVAVPDDYGDVKFKNCLKCQRENRITHYTGRTCCPNCGSDEWDIAKPLLETSAPVAVPAEMTPQMMRAVQLYSELGSYATSNLSGAYGLFAEFWKVACRAAMIKAGPEQE